MSGSETDESGGAVEVDSPRCSFCRKAPGEGVILIEGPVLEGSWRASICSDCVELCTSMIEMQKGRVAGGIPEDPGVHDAATREMLRAKVDEVLSHLSETERAVIERRYGLADGYSYTLEEVGHLFEMARERVREIEAGAVAKLQERSPGPAAGRVFVGRAVRPDAGRAGSASG